MTYNLLIFARTVAAYAFPCASLHGLMQDMKSCCGSLKCALTDIHSACLGCYACTFMLCVGTFGNAFMPALNVADIACSEFNDLKP